MDDLRREGSKEKAERAFKRKEDATQATITYEAECIDVRARTMRLKAQRLAKQAQEKTDAGVTQETTIREGRMAKRGSRPRVEGMTRAFEMADQQLDRLGDQTATKAERVTRKTRLLRGPKEFRANS